MVQQQSYICLCVNLCRFTLIVAFRSYNLGYILYHHSLFCFVKCGVKASILATHDFAVGEKAFLQTSGSGATVRQLCGFGEGNQTFIRER